MCIRDRYIIEGQSNGFEDIPKSIYWTIVTITTVGYGDVVPLTAVGRFLAALLMILGYAIIALPTGIVSAEITKEVEQQKSNLKKNQSLLGTKQKILIDIAKDGFSLGRTYRDSPTVDNYVKINTQLETGKFYNVKIDKALEYDLVGKVINEV